MKQVCPLYRVQFIIGTILATNQPTNQPTNLSYLNKKVVFAYNQTEYIENTRLLLPARSQGRRGLFVCVKLGAHIIN